MVGIHVPRVWKILWNFSTPLALAALFVGAIFTYAPMYYPNGTPYPYWTEYVGFYLILISMVPIPVYALYYLICKNRQQSFKQVNKFHTKNSVTKFQRFQRGINPPSDCDLATKMSEEGFNERAKFLDRASFGFFSSKNGKPARVERRGLTL